MIPKWTTKVDKDFRRVAPNHPPAPQSAFKAWLTHKLTNVGSEQIITFDNAEINIDPPAPQSAFKARLTHKLTNVGPDQIIKFDAAEVNIGNQYNPTTGVFTCDIPGLYVFHLTITTFKDKSVELFFIKNGQRMHNFYLANTGYLGSGSTTALIQLDQGDTVWIKSDQYHSTGDLIDST
ncbi:protein HP-25 homolog 1-like [Mizuhopecten yessoensis]|uniref:protein HP-25 homolog 1-like n=1 Tax=Mizuhopecten yessoensis TaxID=6573 RepID=UPI000B45D075|nr:protein HP-25 homolog 1-like [Mizuhopecten yessoensis]